MKIMSKGLVYLICDPANDLFKIGLTKTTSKKRLKQLQTGNGTELHIVHLHQTQYPYRIENMLHNHFHSKNVMNEWYELNLNDVNNFIPLCLSFEKTIISLKDNPFFQKHMK